MVLRTTTITIAATAAVSAPGGAVGTQRSSAAEGDWRRRVRCGADMLPWQRVSAYSISPPLAAAASRDEQFGEPL